MSVPARHFDSMFDASDDPWKFRTRWYEERKRAMTMACLPKRRFGSAFEPGCANGELTALLAQRCDRLLATDGSAKAVELARDRVTELSQGAQAGAFGEVTLRQAWLPGDWPDGRFDLIVISELAYFLDRDALDATIACARASLTDDGTLLACHWRPRIDGCSIDGDDVHAAFASGLGLPRLMSLCDADMRIDVWCADARSVGLREQLREPSSEAEQGV